MNILLVNATKSNYIYDDLYRLVEANSEFEGKEHHRYELNMEYSDNGRILAKNQLHQRANNGGSWLDQQKTTFYRLQ